jgi:superfamily II DNA or RNA helicase
MIALRPYQVRAVQDLRLAVAQGARAPLLVAPTGSGKTIMAREIVDGAVRKGGKVLFLAPRRELIYQTADKLVQAGIYHGILMAGEAQTLHRPVQVACIPTLHARCLRTNRAALPQASVVLVDEAHLAVAQMTRDILAQYPDAVIIGLTATPCRGDGRGLGEIFDRIVPGPTVAELTQDGFLVPARYFAPSAPDLAGVKITAGDFNERQLGERMDRPKLVGDVVSNWLRLARNRTTVVFATNVAHAMHLREEFERAGVATAHVDGETPPEERKGILRRLSEGHIEVITSVDVLTYGFDCPRLSCAILARPTKSITRYLQSIGRVLRPFAGKADALIIDHAGSVDEHGFADEPREWRLDGATHKERQNASDRGGRERSNVTCGTCKFVFAAQSHCPNCGAEILRRKPKAIDVVDDDLVELGPDKRRKKSQATPAEKATFYSELLGYAAEREKSEGWALANFRAKFKEWPYGKHSIEPAAPSPATLSWIRSRQIAYAKSQQRRAA